MWPEAVELRIDAEAPMSLTILAEPTKRQRTDHLEPVLTAMLLTFKTTFAWMCAYFLNLHFSIAAWACRTGLISINQILKKLPMLQGRLCAQLGRCAALHAVTSLLFVQVFPQLMAPEKYISQPPM